MVHNWKAYFVPVPLEKPSTSATSWRPRYSNIDPNWEKTMPWRLAIGALMVVSQGKAHVKIDEHEFNWVQDQNRMSKVKTWIEMLFDLKRTHHKPLSLQTLPAAINSSGQYHILYINRPPSPAVPTALALRSPEIIWLISSSSASILVLLWKSEAFTWQERKNLDTPCCMLRAYMDKHVWKREREIHAP